MIHCEFQNIEELEANEAYEASEAVAMPSLNKFLLNMLSDQVKMPMVFNSFSWSESVSLPDNA